MDDFKTKPIPDPVVPSTEPDAETIEKKPVRRASKKAPIFESKSVPDPVSMPEELAVAQNTTAPAGMVANIKPIPQPVTPFMHENQHRFKSFITQNKWYIVAMSIGFLIIGVLAFIAFRPQKQEPTKKANVSLSFDAPEIAPASGDVIYKIRIKNNDNVKLVNIQLELLYPEGLSYISSTPKADNLSGSLFNIPDLPPGTDIPVVLKASTQGDVNSELKLLAKLNYKYDQFNSLFTEESTHSIRLMASDVILDFTGPGVISGSQSATYNLAYRNNSTQDIPNAKIVLNYPVSFVFANSDPSPTMGQNTWDVGTVKSQDGGRITINGNFKNTQVGDVPVFEVNFQSPDGNGNYYTQATVRQETQVTDQPLSVDQKIIGGSNGGIVDPGAEVSYEISFRNNSNVVATGVNIDLDLDSSAISSSKISADSGQVVGNTITWNASSLPILAKLSPSDSGSLKFSIKVNNPATTDAQKNLLIISKVQIRSNEQKNSFPGNQLSLKISSPANLSGSVNHVGGPLPLRVGQTSTFKITLEIRNSTNDLNNGLLSAVAPIGVSVDLSGLPESESKAVKYDQATGRFMWNVGLIPAHSGQSLPTRKLSFNVSVTPSDNQVYDAPMLLKNISMNTKDSFTNQNISLKAEDLSTGNLPGEDGLGRVEP